MRAGEFLFISEEREKEREINATNVQCMDKMRFDIGPEMPIKETFYEYSDARK